MLTVCFDGLVGPTHNYAGLSAGNLAATAHAGERSNPRAAALEGLAKMRTVASLGVPQAVLPPHPRPDVATLRRLGFFGTDAEVVERAAKSEGRLALGLVSSASAMWAANSATVAPSSDTRDGKVHLTPANLLAMSHRAIEAPFTTRLLRTIFADADRFTVHDPLPSASAFADEGAANHIRLETSRGAMHLLAWGRSARGASPEPRSHPARQTREASEAIARLHLLNADAVLLPRQDPLGIDAGAFHTDVLAVGLGRFLMLHERAFAETDELVGALREKLSGELVVAIAREHDLSLQDAVRTYVFNSQLVPLADGKLAVVAPRESESSSTARAFLDRLVAEPTPVRELHFVDLSSSMKNGGGPACLRLAVPLTADELAALSGRVLLDETLIDELEAWVIARYRDRLSPEDLGDPLLLRESRAALDELTRILGLGSIYDFQCA